MVCAGRLPKIRQIGGGLINIYRIDYEHEKYYALLEGTHYRILSGKPFKGWRVEQTTLALKAAQLCAPVEPGKIIAIGLNYKSHAREMNMPLPEEPLVFLKPKSALACPGEPVLLPGMSQRVDYEGELAIVIGQQAKDLTLQQAEEAIAGYTLANDVTARDLQARDGQWTRAKGFDGFCPLGPCLVTGVDWRTLAFTTSLNGEVRQVGRMEDLIFDIPAIVSFVSRIMTLMPGDVILTGTPSGIGEVRAGDRVSVHCDQIGTLENTFITKTP